MNFEFQNPSKIIFGAGSLSRLGEVGISDELLSQYAEDTALVVCDENGCLLGRPPMSKEDIIEVLRSAL